MAKTRRKTPGPKLNSESKYRDISAKKLTSAALAIIRREGMHGLSMRSLAAELGVSTMAAYYYVPNKRALIALVLDHVLSAIDYSNIQGTPEERLKEQVRRYYVELLRHPGLTPVIGEGSIAVRKTELWQELYKKAGFNTEALTTAIMVGRIYMYGALHMATAVDKRHRFSEREIMDGYSLILAGMKAWPANPKSAEELASAKPRRK
jgi:hypothetical protein